MLLALDVDGRPCGGGWRTSIQQPGPPDKPIAAGNHANRHLRPVDRLAQEADRRVLIVEHHRRNIDRSHGEPLQQFRQGVVVIAVGVREHDRIDVREPPRPEIARDDAAASGRRRHAAGVVEDRVAVGQFQHDRLAVADAEERAPQPVAIGGPPGDDRCRPPSRPPATPAASGAADEAAETRRKPPARHTGRSATTRPGRAPRCVHRARAGQTAPATRRRRAANCRTRHTPPPADRGSCCTAAGPAR